MGKKSRDDRAEKRESYASLRNKQSKKNTVIAITILLTVLLIVSYSAYVFATGYQNAPGSPPGSGLLGDEHVHSSMLVRIFGDKFDFSQAAYQIKSSWIHFEAQDGTTIHRHSTGVTLGYLFQTLGIGLDDQCFIFQDGREFCSNEENTLKFYVNGEKTPSIIDFVFADSDRILISYGAETQEELDAQIAELDAQLIAT